jgi:hypothetical protein
MKRGLQSEMAYETDERLKSYLDTNQLHREQMCLAVLAADRRFSDVRPRHPRGGPDGARDIEALYQLQQRTFGAVGFVNQANDGDEHKRRIVAKFQEDLEAALKQTPEPEVFVFFTNVNLTVGEKDNLIAEAKSHGLAYCEIFDRERIRIVLDSPDGLSLRFQYLRLPLSEAEQASFFARWGDDIQRLINARFGAVETLLNRIHFFQEANLPLTSLWVSLQLDREYAGSEIGHFRAFAYFQYATPIERVFSILFGAADNTARNDAKSEDDLAGTRFGMLHSIAGAQWEQRLPEMVSGQAESSSPMTGEEYKKLYTKVGSSSSVGRDSTKAIGLSFSKGGFIRFDTGPRLIDLNQSHYVIFMNKALAEKIETMRLFANDYKVAEFTREAFRIEDASSTFAVPMVFTVDELADRWTIIRPRDASLFHVDFAEQTPRRFYSASQVPSEAV